MYPEKRCISSQFWGLGVRGGHISSGSAEGIIPFQAEGLMGMYEESANEEAHVLYTIHSEKHPSIREN